MHAACHVLRVTCCLLDAVCWMLHAVWCMLHAACYVSHAVCCMLYVACCVLHVPCLSSEYAVVDWSATDGACVPQIPLLNPLRDHSMSVDGGGLGGTRIGRRAHVTS
jgi:hypothetical protein